MKHVLVCLSIILFASFVFSDGLGILQISNSSTIPSTIYAGDLVTVTFDVENITATGNTASDVVISSELNENDFIPIKVSENVGSILSRSSKTVSFRFRVKEPTLPGSYTLPFLLKYRSSNSEVVQAESLDFSVAACSTLKIGDIELNSPNPHIGSQLEISASIYNLCSTSARNVSVELRPVTNSTIAPFVVTSGTIQKIGEIAPDESEKATFTMNIGDKVDAQAYVFSIDANCDECSKSSKNQFSFLVLGEPDLVFSNIEYSVDGAIAGASDKQIMQGSTFTLSVQLDNIGEEKAKAVEVSVDFGEGIIGSAKSFLGNINPEDSGAAVFNLQAAYDAKAGPNNGTITIDYIDELGQKKQLIEDYSLYINEQPPTSPIVYIIILVLIIAALGVAYFVARFIFRQIAMHKAQLR